jgi:hypothetical protein
MTCLTGGAGMLMLVVAFVMMVAAAPGQPHGPAQPPAVHLTTDVGHQLTSRGGLARPGAHRAVRPGTPGL